MLRRIARLISEFSIVKIALFIASILVFHVLFDKIILFVENNLFVSKDFFNFWIDLVIILTSICTMLFFGIRFWYTRYKASSYTLFIILLLFYYACYIFLQSEILGWSFYKDSIFEIFYVLYFQVPGLLLLIYFLISSMFSWLINDPLHRSQFLSDEPISESTQDRLEYKPYVDNLSRILLNESFSKSFSIALVGPWGNGKSSILDLVKNEIHLSELDRQSNLFVNFLPYLNHKEEEIINEFFILLSNQLSKYDGEIANQILNYSQKITDLYNSKSITDFVSKPYSILSNKAAKELYEKINESLARINKKIIVFIDDLDRLSGNEIIQILKLIRNTANFKNTIFVVAMDKDYVLQRLKSSNEVLNSAYLEKFFQLEIYLPEIDKNVLKENFIEAFDKKNNYDTSDFIDKIKNALLNRNILFDDYVKNLRDVKRYTNQIKFDYPFVQNEINLVDFINFTFFKTKFPSMVGQLYIDRSNLLFYDKAKDTYYIEEIEEAPEENPGAAVPFNLSGLIENIEFNTTTTISTKDLEEFNKYKIFKTLIVDNDCFESKNNVDCVDRYLLIKTLYQLFGKKEINSSDSIQLSDNLNIIFQRKIQSHVFTKKDFENILSFSDLDDLTKKVFDLNSQKKLPQFLKKLQWFAPIDLEQLKRIIEILLHLYQVKKDYGLNHVEIDNRLDNCVKKLIDEKYDPDKENSNWLWENIFDKDYFSIDNQIYILGDLWASKNDNYLWGFSVEEVSKKAIELYSTKLDSLKGTTWKINQFQFWGYYHTLKNIPDVQPKLNEEFKSFWIDRDIKLLCAQTIDCIAFSYSVYRISDVIIDIFGPKKNYVTYIKSHKSCEEKEIKEYIQFLELLEKTNFNNPLDYRFYKFQLANKRIEKITEQYKNNTSYDEVENIAQIIFETNDKEIFYKIREQNNYNLLPALQIYNPQGSIVMRINLNKKQLKSELLKVAEFINRIGADFSGWESESLDKAKLTKNESFLTHTNDSKKYIKIIHPKTVKF